MQSTNLLIALVATVMLSTVAAFDAQAQSDAEVYESAISDSASVCPGHAKDRTTPGVKAVKVEALRVLRANRVVLCPDRRLDASMPVVWYGNDRVLQWNPEVDGAAELMADKADEMTRNEAFPVALKIWNADGSEAQGAVAPSFEPRPQPRR